MNASSKTILKEARAGMNCKLDATTSTELLPSTDPNGGGSIIHVTSESSANSYSFFDDLLQAFAMQAGATATVDVFVDSGVVLAGLYAENGKTLLGYAPSTTTHQWQNVGLHGGACD